MSKFLSFIYFVAVGVFVSHGALAGVTTIQAIDFGEFAVKLNDAQYDITINPDGSYNFDAAAFVEITAPQEGIYDFDSLPASTAVTVTITQITPLSAFGPDFEMVNLQDTHPANTDASGVVRINVGGTARTSGSGGPYSDETFNGSLNILVTY